MSFCLTLGNELSKETCMLTKQNALLGRDAQAENSRVKGPGRTAPPHASQSQVLLELGVSFPGYLRPVILLISIFDPIPGSTYISGSMVSGKRISGRLAEHIMACHLLHPVGPSQILPSCIILVFTTH